MSTSISLSKAEKSYIQASLKLHQHRADGRSLIDFRPIAVQTDVAPLANGSARVSIGGKTEVLVATKLYVSDEGGGIECHVTCSPAAYPHLSSSSLEDLQSDMSTLLHTTLSHPSLLPASLSLGAKKAWRISLDAIIQSDGGNVYDALFMGARAALHSTRVPRTRSVSYRKTGAQAEDESGLDTRKQAREANDFELVDYWDEGEILDGRERWPVCVTLNVVDDVVFLDASSEEEAATPLRVLFCFAFPISSEPVLQGMRVIGSTETNLKQMESLLSSAESHAKAMFNGLDAKLKDEEVRRGIKARKLFEEGRRRN